MRGTRRLASKALQVLLPLAAVYASAVACAGVPDIGVWQQNRFNVYLSGLSTRYTCDELQKLFTYLLAQSGAKINSPVAAEPCRGGATLQRFSEAALNFDSLRLATGTSTSADVVGTWRHIEISSHHTGGVLTGTDCDLVVEFAEDVLVKHFETRNVVGSGACNNFRNDFDYRLTYDVFVPASAPSN